MKSLEQKIKDLTWFDSISKLKDIFTEIRKSLVKSPDLLNKSSNTTIVTISPDGTFAKTQKSDFLSGIGGGGTTPTLNQVIIAGNTATNGSNTIELFKGGVSNNFIIGNGLLVNPSSSKIEQALTEIDFTATNGTFSGNRESKLTLGAGTGPILRWAWQGFTTTLNFIQPTSSYTLSIPTEKTGNQIVATISDLIGLTKFVSSNYSILPQDELIILNTASGSATFTLPSATSQLVPVGKRFTIKNLSEAGGVITLAGFNDGIFQQTIDGSSTKTFSTLYSGCVVMSTGNNWIIVSNF